MGFSILTTILYIVYINSITPFQGFVNPLQSSSQELVNVEGGFRLTVLARSPSSNWPRPRHQFGPITPPTLGHHAGWVRPIAGSSFPVEVAPILVVGRRKSWVDLFHFLHFLDVVAESTHLSRRVDSILLRTLSDHSGHPAFSQLFMPR
jgi:hypothetical protein